MEIPLADRVCNPVCLEVYYFRHLQTGAAFLGRIKKIGEDQDRLKYYDVDLLQPVLMPKDSHTYQAVDITVHQVSTGIKLTIYDQEVLVLRPYINGKELD